MLVVKYTREIIIISVELESFDNYLYMCQFAVSANKNLIKHTLVYVHIDISVFTYIPVKDLERSECNRLKRALFRLYIELCPTSFKWGMPHR